MPDLLKRLIGLDLPKGVFLNVNFPNCPLTEVKGVRVTAQGKLDHGLMIEERADGRGFPYYWLRFGRGKETPADESDVKALWDSFVSVTPLHLDFTAHAMRGPLEKALA